MPRLCYVPKRFSADHALVISQANVIIGEYAAQGYDLTLRQLYYQFVARDLIPNRQQAYKRLGSIVNDARLAGEIDWNALVDRTRNPLIASGFESPKAYLSAVADGYYIHRWEDQPYHVEVWVEKEALAGVIERATGQEGVSSFACRGYVSQSEQWRAAMRFRRKIEAGKKVVVLHLGDHDPSGIDMTRDNSDRLYGFIAAHLDDPVGDRFAFHRIALNMDQVQEYDPPPNPAKLTDSRVGGYLDDYGDESWELDALPPDVLASLIVEHVRRFRDDDLYEARVALEEHDRQRISDHIQALPDE